MSDKELIALLLKVIEGSCGPLCSHEGCSEEKRKWESKNGSYWKMRVAAEQAAEDRLRKAS